MPCLAALLLWACADPSKSVYGEAPANGPERSRQISECTVNIEFNRDRFVLDRSGLDAVRRAAALAGQETVILLNDRMSSELPYRAQERTVRVRTELARWGVPESRVKEATATGPEPASPRVLLGFCGSVRRVAPSEPDRLVRYRTPPGTDFAIPIRYLPRDLWSDTPFETLIGWPPGLALLGPDLQDRRSRRTASCESIADLTCPDLLRVGFGPWRESETSQFEDLMQRLPVGRMLLIQQQRTGSWGSPPYDTLLFKLPVDNTTPPEVRCYPAEGLLTAPPTDGQFPKPVPCRVSRVRLHGDTAVTLAFHVGSVDEAVRRYIAVRSLLASFLPR